MISENSLVFDVNIGPVELKKEYPNAVFYFGDISCALEEAFMTLGDTHEYENMSYLSTTTNFFILSN
jgi:hypothetical protein